MGGAASVGGSVWPTLVMWLAAKAAAVDTAVAENASTKMVVAWWSVAAAEGM